MPKEIISRQERRLIALMRIWTVVFLVAGITFAYAPDQTIRSIEEIGRIIFGWNSAPVELGRERFWLVLVFSLMMTLTYLAFMAQTKMAMRMHAACSAYVHAILVSKMVSTVGFMVCFILAGTSFVYLAGAAVDGAIFLITFFICRSATKAKTQS